MDKFEYKRTQDAIKVIATLVRGIDLAGFIREAEIADTIGPFADPTLWMAASGRLNVVMRAARALAAFRAVVAEYDATPAGRAELETLR